MVTFTISTSASAPVKKSFPLLNSILPNITFLQKKEEVALMNEKGIKPQSSEEQSQKRNAIDIAKEHIQQLCEGFQQSPEKIAEY